MADEVFMTGHGFVRCEREYSYAKDMSAKCEACQQPVALHRVPFNLEQLTKLLDGAFNRGIELSAEYIKTQTLGESTLLAAQIRGLVK